jgi:hypothetical protein
MTVMEPGSEILKVDEVGCIQTPPEKREALPAEYDRSGMTGAQFARFSGVRYATLMYRLQKRRKEVGQSEPMAPRSQDHPRWLEARVAGEVPKSENLVVELGGGVRMLVGKRRWREKFSGRWDWAGNVEFSGSDALAIACQQDFRRPPGQGRGKR